LITQNRKVTSGTFAASGSRLAAAAAWAILFPFWS
jgi:hypothetical protein